MQNTCKMLPRLASKTSNSFAFACLTVLSLAAMASAATVSVNSALLFNATGILASGGEAFQITATGTVNLALFDGPYITDPNGRIVTAPPVGSGAFNFFTNSAAPIGIAPSVGNEKTIVEFAAHLVGAPYGALVAGFSPRPFPAGFGDFPNGFTLIGSSGIATAPASGGFLLLAVNDVDNTADNGGSFAAEISQVPESGTLLLLTCGLCIMGLVGAGQGGRTSRLVGPRCYRRG